MLDKFCFWFYIFTDLVYPNYSFNNKKENDKKRPLLNVVWLKFLCLNIEEIDFEADFPIQ